MLSALQADAHAERQQLNGEPKTASHTIVLGEPRNLIRSFMGAVLNSEERLDVRALATSLDDLLLACHEFQPRLVLVSAAFGQPAVFEQVQKLRASFPQCAVVFFALDARDHFIAQAMDAGAAAYLTAVESKDTFLDALERVAQGGIHFSPDVEERRSGQPQPMSGLMHEPKVRPRLDTLTPRELEVLACIAQGLSKKEIARRLNRSHKTIDNHSTNLMNKLDIHDRVVLARYAIREGLASL